MNDSGNRREKNVDGVNDQAAAGSRHRTLKAYPQRSEKSRCFKVSTFKEDNQLFLGGTGESLDHGVPHGADHPALPRIVVQGPFE